MENQFLIKMCDSLESEGLNIFSLSTLGKRHPLCKITERPTLACILSYFGAIKRRMFRELTYIFGVAPLYL